MTVVALHCRGADAVSQARALASDLHQSLDSLRGDTLKAIEGVRKARTLEKVLLRYGAWLGRYHAHQINVGFEMHTRLLTDALPQHKDAMDRIRCAISDMGVLIGQPAHWMSIPNLKHTRWSIEALLSKEIRAIDIALSGCAVLKGGAA